jgi:acetyl-CoA acetyltransferase
MIANPFVAARLGVDVARAVEGADHRHVHGEHILDEHAAVPGLLVERHEALLRADVARRTGMAPIDAIPKALARAGVDQGDIDLFEIIEAFCSVPVAATRALGIDREICNVNGSACSLGHPIAATGARMVVSMVHELRRRDARLGCVSMCAGGGMGMVMVVEVL